MSKIYIVSPTATATGGTELLHQLSNSLIERGIPTYMYYVGNYDGSNVQKRFGSYKINICKHIEDNGENLLIVPETLIRFLYKFRKINKAVWWLSVDFYPGVNRPKVDLLHTIVRFLRDQRVRLSDKKWIHFTQSEYARRYLLNDRRIPSNMIFPLSDYINHTYLDNNNFGIVEKKDIVLYNPKKGFEFTSKILSYDKSINFIPLVNLSPEEMKRLMLGSKVYIDFGNHPGKDRIPREAALCGCCVITGKRGSAANEIDVMIPEDYKFDDNDGEIPNIVSMIKQCLSSYEQKKLDFFEYLEKIKSEEKQFDLDIDAFFSRYR